MQIEVIHSAFEEEAEHVANVAAPHTDVDEEYSLYTTVVANTAMQNIKLLDYTHLSN